MTVLDRPGPTLLPSARTDAPGTGLPQLVASRALARAAAMLSWGWLAVAPLVFLAGPAVFDVPAFLLVVTGMAVVAGICTAVAVRRPGALAGLTVAGLVAVAAGIAAFCLLMPARGVPSNPAVSLMGAACLVAGLVLRPGAAGLAALGLAVWHSAWDLGPPDGDAVPGYLQLLLTAACTVAAGRFVSRSLVRSSLEVSELVTRLLDRQRAERDDRVRESSLTAVRTDLHDTVLTTLSGIGAGWLRTADPSALRAELQRDFRLLADMHRPSDDEPVDLAAALGELVGMTMFDRLDVTVEVGTDDRSCPIPAVAADALLLATREALVNVRKHAGAGSVTVTFERERGTVEVTIRDRGVGFDRDEPVAGLGLRGIESRLADVGGWAVVDTAPGAGTTVRLVLPGDAGTRAGRVPPLWSREGPRRAALWLVVVSGVAQTLSFVLQAGSYADPGPQTAALAVALAVDALVVVVLARRATLPGWLSVVLVVRIPVVLLLTGLSLPGCDSMGYAHFSGGGEFFPVIVLALLRPPGEAVAATGLTIASWAALAAPLYASGAACGITGVANSALTAGLLAGALTFVGALRRHAAMAAEVLAAEERLAAARSAQQVRSVERGRLMDIVGGIVTGTLQGLADGRLDPDDAEVRRSCLRDARLLRGFLHSAGDTDDLVPQLFARSVQSRPEGIDLDVRGDLPRDTLAPADRSRVLAVVDACLGWAGGAGWSGEGLVTALRAGDDLLVTLVLRQVAAATTDAAGSAVPGVEPGWARVDLVDGDLWVTCRAPVRQRDPGGSPS